MGLLPRVVGCGMVAAVCALACNALTGADALVVGDREIALSSGNSPGSPDGANDDTTLEATSSSGTSGNAASSSSSSGDPAGSEDSGTDPPPPRAGTIIDATFSNAGACTSSIVTNGASTAYDANGRTSGACKVCAVASGEMFLELTGTATKQGQAKFEAYAKRVPGAATPTSAAIQFNVGGSSVASSDAIGDTWAQLGGGSISVQNGSTVLLRIGVSNATAGDCLLIDDVRVAVP